jgi:pseudouridine kinase
MQAARHSRGVSIKPYCVVIGGANMDLLGAPQGALKQHTSNPGKVSSSAGGVGRNIADNLVRLGQSCWLMAPIGDDANGKFLEQHCQQLGIQTEGMVKIAGKSTSTYLSIIDETGEMLVAIADMTLIDTFGAAQLQPFLPQLEAASIVVLDANLAPECLSFIIQNLPQQHFFVDTVSVAKATRITPFLAHVHTLKPNFLEAQAIAGTDFGAKPSNAQLLQLAQWFTGQGVKHLYLSLGAKGLLYSDSEQCFVIGPSIPIDVNDIANSNGAGDAMMAAIVDAWLQGCDASSSAVRALTCAQIAMASETTINPQLTPHLLHRMLKEYSCHITPLN